LAGLRQGPQMPHGSVVHFTQLALRQKRFARRRVCFGFAPLCCGEAPLSAITATCSISRCCGELLSKRSNEKCCGVLLPMNSVWSSCELEGVAECCWGLLFRTSSGSSFTMVSPTLIFGGFCVWRIITKIKDRKMQYRYTYSTTQHTELTNHKLKNIYLNINSDPGSGLNIPDPQHCQKVRGPSGSGSKSTAAKQNVYR